MPISVLLFWLSFLAASAGAGLLVLGLRGRRVGTDVFCARCGYNLRGRDLRKLDEQCTECGAKIDRRGATRVGVRRRRPWAIALGALLALLGFPLVAATVLAGLRAIDLNPYKPTWLLFSDAVCGAMDAELAAIQELDRRVKANLIVGPQLADLASKGLDAAPRQAPTVGAAWQPIVQMAWDTGVLPTERIRELIRPRLDVHLAFAPFGRMGHEVPVGFTFDVNPNPAAAAIELHEVEVTLQRGDRVIRTSMQERLGVAGRGAVHKFTDLNEVRRGPWRADPWYLIDPVAELGTSAAGQYTVNATLIVEIRPPKQDTLRYEFATTGTLQLRDRIVLKNAPARRISEATTRASSPVTVTRSSSTGKPNFPRLDPWRAPSLNLPPARPPPSTQTVALALPPPPLDLPDPPAPATQPIGLTLTAPSLNLPDPPPPTGRAAPPLPDIRMRPAIPERRPAFDTSVRSDDELSRIERSLRRSAALQSGELDGYEFDPDDFRIDSQPRRRILQPPGTQPAGQ